MPAKNLLRVDGEGIYSHIYNKGVEKRIIFNDQKDYQVFIDFLQDYLTPPKDPESTKKEFKVHGRTFRGTPHQPKNYFNEVELVAYCLMPNHFHLLLHQKTQGSLEKFIRSLCTRYSMYFNKKYNRSGALFEGPYKSVQIEDRVKLLHLTGYLHHAGGYCSYPEYLGSRQTSWVKQNVILSNFDKGPGWYKDFVEKYELDQKEKELIDAITLESGTDHLPGRDLTREVQTEPDSELRSSLPDFLAISIAVFVLLATMGVGNIMLSVVKSSKASPTPAVLGKIEDESTAPADAGKSKKTLTVKIDDGSSSVNIRQKPTTDSEKIGKAKDGDTFEFVAENSDWFEVKLTDGSVGFISAKYLVLEE